MKLTPPLSLQELSAVLKARFVGDPNLQVSGINEINVVEKGNLTFVDHQKYFHKALNSEASVILLNKEVDCPDGKGLILSEDPFGDFVSLIRKFKPFEPSSQLISPSAEIGVGTVVMPGAFVGNNVSIGTNCIIHPNVTIYDNTVIGHNVIIHSGSVIGSDALYFKRRPTHYDKLESGGRVVIEDNVEIGSCCSIDRGVTNDTTIGDGTKVDSHVHVGHDTRIGKNCLVAAQVGVSGCVVIEDDVVLWGQAGIPKGLVIGKGAVVLGQAGVINSLEGGKTYVGSPAQEARGFWKTQALLRKLPQYMDKVEKLEPSDGQ